MIKKFENYNKSDPYGEENWEDIPNEPGVCHNCGSKNLDWGSSIIFPMGDQIGYEYDCIDCNFAGYEVYNLVFVGHEGR